MHHKKETTPMSNVRRILKFVWAGIYQYKPTYYLVYVLDMVLKILQPFIDIVFPKLIIDELVGERDVRVLAIYTGTMIGLNVLIQYVLTVTSENLSKVYHDDITRKFEADLGRKIMNMDFENTENKNVLDRAEKAKNGFSWAGGIGGINGTVSSLVSSALTMAGIIGIMITGPWPVLVFVTLNVVGTAVFNQKNNQINRRYFGSFAEKNRPFSYLFYKLSDIRYAKDIRLYGADAMMLEHADSYNREIVDLFHKQSKESLKYYAGISLGTIVSNALAFLYLGYQVIHRFMTVGGFTMYISAANTFSSSAASIITSLQNLIQKCYFINEYVSFMKLPDHKEEGELPVTKERGHSIEFCHVYFRYPQSEEYVLEDVNINIQEGEHLAIVGRNGAGKTTFVKLLCRLYDVTEGSILLDGVDIRQYDYEEYIQMLSVVFQDFKLFACSALENLVLKDLKDYDQEKLWKILNQVQLKEKFESLPEGIHTNMFRYFDDHGVELSGGEQQKMAIARALYKDAPLVILDEPTAALDPKAESEIYEQFHELIRSKTAIYISHRLSSCRFCDHIAVFSDKTLKEYGTHDELVAKEDGIYAELFHVQAQYYQV